MSSTPKNVSWVQYVRAIDKISTHFLNVSRKRFDVIIGLTRGGLIPAVMLSHALNTPMLPFNPHVLHANGVPRGPLDLEISPAVTRRVLIVDDISDTGKTFDKTVTFFENRGFTVTTTAVYINKDTTIFTPDFVVWESHRKWVVFPYEY